MIAAKVPNPSAADGAPVLYTDTVAQTTANAAYALAVSVAGTVGSSNFTHDDLTSIWAGTATADKALAVAGQGTNLATTAIQTAWYGTNAAETALQTAWAGTNAAVSGVGLANQALILAETGTATADTALAVAGQGTNLAYIALQTAWTGTAATAATSYVTSDAHFFVNGTASDANNGSVNTPWQTIQHAVNAVVGNQFVTSLHAVTIHIADGTYSENVTLPSPNSGCGSATLLGNTGSPQNVIIAGGAGVAITTKDSLGLWYLSGMELRGTYGILARGNYMIRTSTAMRFGTCSVVHMSAEDGGYISLEASYTVAATGGLRHFSAAQGGVIHAEGITITLLSAPVFTDSFAFGANNASLLLPTLTFSGTATGKKYYATSNGVIDTRTANINYLPGTVPGNTTNGIYS